MDDAVKLPLGGQGFEITVQRARVVETLQDIYGLLSKDKRLQESGVPSLEELERRFFEFVNSEEFQRRLSKRRSIPGLDSSNDYSDILSRIGEHVIPNAQQESVDDSARLARMVMSNIMNLLPELMEDFLLPFESRCVTEWLPKSANNLDQGIEQVMEALKWAFYHDFYRRLIRGWEAEDNLRPGTIKIVEAMMGLGKTYQYVHTLIERRDLTAIIFLPTKKTIEQVLRWAEERGKKDDFHRVFGVDEESQNGCDPCIHAKEIIERGDRGIYGRRAQFCQDCRIKKTCGIYQSEEQAVHKRVVVTTHAQYVKFAFNPEFACFERNGQPEPRKVWIVDEDLITNYLYRIPEREFTLGAVQDVVEGLESRGIDNTKFKQLRDQIQRPLNVIVMPPIDPNYDLTQDELGEWARGIQARNYSGEWVQPADWIRYAVSAINHGYTMSSEDGEKRIRPPVITEIPIDRLPAHVFFDGTPPHDRFFSLVYRSAVDIQRMPAVIPMPGSLTVLHTNTTGLPLSSTEIRREQMIKYVEYVVSSEREWHKKLNIPQMKIFIAAKGKPEREEKHEAILREELPKRLTGITIVREKDLPPQNGDYIIIGHYGNLRGLNDAEKCSVGIMLGSFTEPWGVTIARALPFLDDIPEEGIAFSEIMRDDGSYEKGESVRLLGSMIRSAELQQAMTRTRHIYHPVHCYVVANKADSVEYFPFIGDGDYEIHKKGCEILPQAQMGAPDDKRQEMFVACDEYRNGHTEIVRKDVVRLLVDEKEFKERTARHNFNLWAKNEVKEGRLRCIRDGYFEVVT